MDLHRCINTTIFLVVFLGAASLFFLAAYPMLWLWVHWFLHP
jgi:hypothetical protein